MSTQEPQPHELFNSLDFKKLFTKVFKLSEEMFGEEDHEDWTAEKREDTFAMFGDVFDRLQEEIPEIDATNMKQGLANAVEELHPADDV